MANKAPSPFKEIDKLTEKHMQVILLHYLLVDLQKPVVIPNIQYVDGNRWESDICAVSKSGYASEYEIKIDRWDFLRDFRKVHKHRFYSNEKSRLPFKQFYYVVPEGMVSADELPEYAGLIYIGQHGNSIKPLNATVKVIKQSPNRKVSKITPKKINQINRSLAWKIHNFWLSEVEREVSNG